MDDEKQFIRKLSSKSKELDKPEIAVEFARLLIAHERFRDAQLIVHTALYEGPRYDLYEMRASRRLNYGSSGDRVIFGNRPVQV